ncbi:phosphatidylserine decarboxylase [Acetobacterium wieringae]|uniref:phosphatidylserine decarboxylase n=1 Tax=Acetobacterium wieringae TaxID=52694 RepID=UPI00203487B9|nr:phosphatidylserine decarboxylase [Acetobacterium wieringae]URN82866.1 phosphatidylserine decarboxylase [Acetobacterium wieringae]
MRKLVSLFLVVSLLLLSTPVAWAQNPVHEPITEELILMVDHNPELQTLLEKSIDQAKTVNPDKNSNPVQSLEAFYDYIDWASKAMPWTILPNVGETYPALYDQIDQSLDYFYFITDQPLEELADMGYYNNSLQYHEPYRSWMIKFTKEWGQYLSTPASWNDSYYQTAYNNLDFGLQNGWYEDPANWHSFNDFFSRYLVSPDVRPIAAPEDEAVVVAPADSVPQGVWQIDGDSRVVGDGVKIKSLTFDSIPALLGAGSEYSDAFAGGVLTHTFLNVQDYHRFHFPVGGTIREVRSIYQDDAVGGITYWDEQAQRYMLNAEDYGWQAVETRGSVILETVDYGLVALIPVGMSQVSSVLFEENIKPGMVVKKGDMLGYFLFGGSDYVMIFQNGAGFSMTAAKNNSGDGYEHLLMGQAYGVLTGNPTAYVETEVWENVIPLVLAILLVGGVALVTKKSKMV